MTSLPRLISLWREAGEASCSSWMACRYSPVRAKRIAFLAFKRPFTSDRDKAGEEPQMGSSNLLVSCMFRLDSQRHGVAVSRTPNAASHYSNVRPSGSQALLVEGAPPSRLGLHEPRLQQVQFPHGEYTGVHL